MDDLPNCIAFLLPISSGIYGARPIRWIEKFVVTQLSKMLVREEIDQNSTAYIEAAQGKNELVHRVKNDGFVNPKMTKFEYTDPGQSRR
jgi:hypothetical protein